MRLPIKIHFGRSVTLLLVSITISAYNLLLPPNLTTTPIIEPNQPVAAETLASNHAVRAAIPIDAPAGQSGADATTTAGSTPTVTRTPTQQLRKVKLFPGKYKGTIHIEVANDFFHQGIDAKNWLYVFFQWRIQGTLDITVSKAGSAKAHLVFTQIDGTFMHNSQVYDQQYGFTCHAIGIVIGHIATISQTVDFNPDDGNFTIPFKIFNINVYGIFAHLEGDVCNTDESSFLDKQAQQLKGSALALNYIDFTVNTVESESIGAGDNQNCAMQTWVEGYKMYPTYTESCHWQVYKLSNKPNGWKK